MSLRKSLLMNEELLSVTGLGYVGLQLAAEFSKYFSVIGFDINDKKVQIFKQGLDITNEIGNEVLRKANIFFTSDEKELERALFHIVSVPTPIDKNKLPDLTPIISASESIGRNLRNGAIVVYESTVYPGVTEDICIPILEKHSELSCGKDFKVGYSPERISPGSKEHSLVNSIKIVSGMDQQTLDTVADVYNIIIEKQNIYKAESIKIAEAAKVIENTQRDVNIALMNELSVIFNKLGIDTKLVIKAASTKWNFMNLMPGLVGGHCIGVDPYYLLYASEQLGYRPSLVTSSRVVNDNMGKYIAQSTINQLIKADIKVNGSKVLIFGFTYKEDVPDVRNTKVFDIVKTLQSNGINVSILDYLADKDEVYEEYGVDILDNIEKTQKFDAIIMAVLHKRYRDFSLNDLKELYINSTCVLIDVKSFYDRKAAEQLGYRYWCL